MRRHCVPLVMPSTFRARQGNRSIPRGPVSARLFLPFFYAPASIE